MKSRSVLAVLFLVLCLALSGLVVRRQMAAHPASAAARGEEALAQVAPRSFPGGGTQFIAWHRLTGAKRQAVLDSIQGQLRAFRENDSHRAALYQSRRLRQNSGSDEQFTEMIRTRYPEFGHCRAVRFGPVWGDANVQRAAVRVTVTGENGQQARGGYLLVKEEGTYRVAGVEGGGRIRPEEARTDELDSAGG